MLNEKEISDFFNSTLLNHPDYFICDYQFETDAHPKMAAAILCQEMSTALWKRPGVEEDLRKKFSAFVIDLQQERSPYHVKIAYPIIHTGDSIPRIFSSLAGEGTFYAPEIKTIRWLDFHLPQKILEKFSGPQFGLEGLRTKLQVFDRPFFIGVIKPNLGLPAQDFASIAEDAWRGGLDIAKDDEMLADPPYNPLKDRMEACARSLECITRKYDRTPLMIANITDEVATIKNAYQEAYHAGANAVMLNSFFTGFSALRSLRKFSLIPVMSHFTGMALYDRSPLFGIDGKVLVKWQRLAGADIIGLPGFGDRMRNESKTVLDNIKTCLEPMGPSIKSALPVPGGSDWAGTLPLVFEKVGHTNFGFISGRGIFSHPDGPFGGAQSLMEAWEAVKNGLPLTEAAKTKPFLKKALEKFGSETS